MESDLGNALRAHRRYIVSLVIASNRWLNLEKF